MEKYTEQVHATRLLNILEAEENTCSLCPVGFDQYTYYEDKGSWLNDPCDVCPRFVGGTLGHSPCFEFGHKEAIKRSWIALEEKGYI
jgi:hypothetical protein